MVGNMLSELLRQSGLNRAHDRFPVSIPPSEDRLIHVRAASGYQRASASTRDTGVSDPRTLRDILRASQPIAFRDGTEKALEADMRTVRDWVAMSRTPVADTFLQGADVYDRHIGRYGRELALELIKFADVRPGQRALDVGCGPGALTKQLASVLGAEQVSAIDPSSAFVQACQERLPGVHAEVAAAEALPFGDEFFDRTLAQLVVNFMTDAEAGVREMCRVTRSGSIIAAAVWDYAGQMTLLRRFWDSVAALDPSAADLDEGRSMRYCTPDELQALWTGAGLEKVSISDVVVTAGYEGFEDLWEPLQFGVSPSGAYVASLSPDRRAELKADFQHRLGAGNEPFRLGARAWLVAGRVP
jgi:ubiquinone/menaquinone biosynthesis C-methylase UbiE